MFDLITGKVPRPFHDRNTVPTFVSIVAHFFIIATVVVIPVLYVTDQLPDVPAVMAFVATPPAPPPPPPPPPPPAVAGAAARVAPPVVEANPQAAPIEAPAAITPENEADTQLQGVEGGVEGGVPGGVVVGGIVGGLVLPAPPPPPPPPPRPTAPIRIGGQVKAPALITRVQPVYPEIAVAAQVEGDVVLEATVNAEGLVESVRVLQSRSRFLDKAAVDAVKQWRYSPLILNDTAWPFILTVTLTFSIHR